MIRPWFAGRGTIPSLWIVPAILLIVLAYCRFFAGSYFTQDDYVWLCFGKFYANPPAVFWRDTLCGQFYRPLGQLWWWAMHAVGGERVVFYQVGFLAVHLMNSVLAGALAGRLCGKPIRGPVALLFALNPLFVSPISIHYQFIFDTLGFGFYLLSLLLVSGGVRWRPKWVVMLSVLAAVASYFSKEAFFTLPAMIGLVLGIREPGNKWTWQAFRQHLWIWVTHVLAWGLALGYRGTIIGNVGGYGLAAVSTLRDLVAHAAARITTWCDLCLWSIAPVLSDWLPAGIVQTVSCLVLIIALTWLSFRVRASPGPVWIWAWLVLTWTPSMLMVTFAPVSFYACSFASTLLIVLALSRAKSFQWIALAIGIYYAVFAFNFFGEREPEVATLKLQHRVLRDLYPNGGTEAHAGDRIFLLGSSTDLFADPIVKYGTPTGHRIPDVLFFNDKAPIAWVVTDPQGPGSIAPIYISPDYQDGYMDMDPYRVYPLSFAGRRREILQAGPSFRFMKWEGKRLIDITIDNPDRPQVRNE
jgi:hypothetical protein